MAVFARIPPWPKSSDDLQRSCRTCSAGFPSEYGALAGQPPVIPRQVAGLSAQPGFAFAFEHVDKPLERARIAAEGADSTVKIPEGAQTIDLPGQTVIPGLVGMHEHLFYPSMAGVPLYTEHAFSFPRLYLASGVTTARTAGSSRRVP